MDGVRSGGIISMRGMCQRAMKYGGEEQGYVPSKETLKKIKRETDEHLLETLFWHIIRNKLTVKFVDENYDKLFLEPENTRKERFERTFDEVPLKNANK
jgi:hypothetical protein